MELNDYRDELEKIDSELVDVFARRMAVSADIAKYKKEHDIPIFDPSLDRSKMHSVAMTSPEQIRDYTPLLYSMIFELSKSYQNRLNGCDSDLAKNINEAIENTPKLFPEFASIACQGIEGANSQYACDKLFKNANIMYFSSFDAVFSAIESGLCDYGIVPVENSSAGTVNSVYDLMMDHKFSIIRSVRLKIDHNLLALPGTEIKDIKEIYSHEQALNQCSRFLSTLKDVKIIACENTAVAARMVASSNRKDIAALASTASMKCYGLKCLKESVQNTDNNYTRFICISKKLEIYPGADKTSIMLILPHEQGSLYKFLSKLYALGINLNKLESRPLPNKEFEFMFYFDLDTPVYSPRLMQLMGELPAACDSFTYLGSYSEVF